MSLILITGPMFAGKSTELIRMCHRYEIVGKQCLWLKYEGDTRYDKLKICTHDEKKVDAIPISKLEELDDKVKNYDVVGIDEIQFIPDAPIFCDKWASEGKIVIVSGLSGDSNREPWEVISKLEALADERIVLTAACLGSNSAPFTSSLVNAKDRVLIGAAETYIASDRITYIQLDKNYWQNLFKAYLKSKGVDEKRMLIYQSAFHTAYLEDPHNLNFSKIYSEVKSKIHSEVKI